MSKEKEQLNEGMPEHIFFKRNTHDFIGVKLQLIKPTTCSDKTPSGYYAKMEGSSSIIKYVALKQLNGDPITSSEFFETLEQLHEATAKRAKSTLEAIANYKEIGSYRKNNGN